MLRFYLEEQRLAKRFKRRIQEVCGLTELSREDKILRASEILSDLEYKQKICNQMVGVSHRDIESVLKDIIKTKKLSKEAQMELDLKTNVPEKLDPPIGAVRSVRPVTLEYLLDEQEVNNLIAASEMPLEDRATSVPQDYTTYSYREVQALVAGNYNNEEFDKRVKIGLPRRRQDKK